MASETARRRARSSLERLVQSPLDTDSLRREAVEILRGAIGFDWWCWALIDPGSRLPTRYLSDNPIIGGAQRRFYRLLHDVHTGWGAAQDAPAASPVSVLSATTAGDLAANPLWRELIGPGGGGDSLQAWLEVDGVCWGLLDLGRERSGGWFDPADAELIAQVTPLLAARLRDGLRTLADVDEEPDEPGTLIVDRDLNLVAATDAAWRWIDRLGLARPSDVEPLPGFMYALATRVGASNAQPPASARVRLPTADHRHWVVVRASPLSHSPTLPGGLALSLEGARSDDLAPLLMRAWSLSPRERDVAGLVIDGLSCDDIAAALYISAHTVKDHLKSIFDKTGVHRRRDLLVALSGRPVAG